MGIANPTHKRQVLIARDGNQCWVCGDPMVLDDPSRDEFATFEHIVPRVQGGANHIDNLRLSHRVCNETRGKLHERLYFDPAKHARNQRLRARAAA